MRQVIFQDACWNVKDIVIPGLPEWSFWDHWENGEFEPGTLETIDRLVTEGSTFVDIGAWIGNVSLWAARRKARVVAVEPDPSAIQILRENIAANAPDVSLFEGAISNQTGTCHLQPHDDGWGSSMTRVASEGLEVPCLTIMDLFDQYEIENCSLVKMDIEGHECKVLERGAPFLAGLGIPLLVAMHPGWGEHSMDPSWFDGYIVEGQLNHWNTVLAIPS